MGRLAPLLLAGSGTATVFVGGYYLLNRHGIEKPSTDELDEFKNENKGDGCVKDLFTSVENLGTLADSSELPKDDTTFFGTQSSETGKNKSCLLISIDKKEYTVGSSTKWTGKFIWSWSFVNDDKGFITFNVAKSSSSDKQLNVIGEFYLLNKESNQWKIKHHKEVKATDDKKIDSGNFDTVFPKFKSSVGAFSDAPSFISDKSKLGEICGAGTDECTGTPTKSADSKIQKWSWTKSSNGNNNDKVGDWSGDDLKWFEHIYGTSPFNLKEKIKDFSGTWQKDEGQSSN